MWLWTAVTEFSRLDINGRDERTGCETCGAELVFLLTIAHYLSVRCLWQGFAGSVKFHFVIIPLFSHSSVSKYCFSKPSLLPSCKDLLLPCSCIPPAVPQTKQFHPFGESSKGSTLSQKCTWTDGLRPHQRQGCFSAVACAYPPSLFPLL